MFSSSDTRVFARSIFLTTDAISFCCFYVINSTPFSGFLISSLISLYSVNTLFTETNSSRLIYKSIKALEIKTSIVFNLGFSKYYFITSFRFLIPAVITPIFNPTAELTISTGRPINEANSGIEIQPQTAEKKNKKMLKVILRPTHFFNAFHSLTHYVLFLVKD